MSNMGEVMPSKVYFKFIAVLLLIPGSDSLGLRQELLSTRQSMVVFRQYQEAWYSDTEFWEGGNARALEQVTNVSG